MTMELEQERGKLEGVVQCKVKSQAPFPGPGAFESRNLTSSFHLRGLPVLGDTDAMFLQRQKMNGEFRGSLVILKVDYIC